MLIPKQIEHYLDVPGFNNPKHLDALAETASSIQPGSRVLEIGPAFGCSTWVLMTNLQKGVELHTCDTFGMNHPALKQRHYNGVMAKHGHNSAISYAMNLYLEKDHRTLFNHNVNQHPRRYEVLKEIHAYPSLELLAKDTNWDMVYIDGLHSYENVSAELNFLKDVPLLCGDDYHPAHPGTMQAIDEFVAKRKLKLVHHEFDTGSGFWKIDNA